MNILKYFGFSNKNSPPPPTPHTHTPTHTQPCKHRQTGSSHCSSTFSQHLSYVLYTFGKRGPFSNWGPYCSFCYKSPVWMPKQTHTCLYDHNLRGHLLFFLLLPNSRQPYKLCTRTTSEDSWEQRTDSRGPIVPIEKCPRTVWLYKRKSTKYGVQFLCLHFVHLYLYWKLSCQNIEFCQWSMYSQTQVNNSARSGTGSVGSNQCIYIEIDSNLNVVKSR